jgi:hypothetical protein
MLLFKPIYYTHVILTDVGDKYNMCLTIVIVYQVLMIKCFMLILL